MPEYRKIKPKDLKELRQKLHEEQDGVCPIMAQRLSIDEMVIDHQHRLNQQQTIGENGAGLIRGAIQRHANSLEGKVTNAWRRYNMDRFDITIGDFLRNLADYLERDNLDIVHPSELPKPKILKKSCYNKLVKAIDGKQKVPDYAEKPRKQKLTKELERLFEKYNINVEFY